MFWVGWPVLWLYLHGSKRTRVIVHHDDKVLVVRSWLGNTWGLPGGGLHAGENQAHGAARELYEETGIKAKPDQLKLLFSNKKTHEYGLPFMYSCFSLMLGSELIPKVQKLELTEARWVIMSELMADKKIGQVAREIISFWLESTTLLH